MDSGVKKTKSPFMKKITSKKFVYWAFLTPALLAFIMTIVIPFIIGVYYSFTNWNGMKVTEFVGFQNYIDVIGGSAFKYAFVLTFIFSFLSVLMINFVAFGLATLVTQKIRGVNFFRAAFFLPNLIGGLILGYIWQFIFNGVMMDVISYSPLSNANSALIALVFVLTWQYAGYIMMIYVTALLNIPEDVIEAAKIDGANRLSQLLYIKLPMLASAFTITLFLTLVNSFKQFDVIFSLTFGGPSRELASGAVVNSTNTLAVDIYQRAFQLKDMSGAQAEAVIFFIILTILSIIQVRVTKSKEVEA